MSITQKMYAVLENIEQQTNLLRSSGVPDNSPIATIYVPSIRESIRIARLELAEKPTPSLLSHLCSLTVAERETILRLTDIAAREGALAQWDDISPEGAACRLALEVQKLLLTTNPDDWEPPSR